MLPMIFGISFLKLTRPFFRKHIVQSITDWEFIFLNSILIAIVSFAYSYIHKKEDITNILKLTWTQYFCAIILVAITMFTSLAIFKLQEEGIVSTLFLLKAVSALLFIAMGVFIFEEEMNLKKLLGILLVLIGMFLIK